MKETLAEEERIKQNLTNRGPSEGFWMCKAAKNPTLFESKLYERQCYPNSDVGHMDRILHGN